MISRVNLRGCCVGSASRTCALHGAWRDTRCRAVYQGPVFKCILVNIQGGMACWPSIHHADGRESFKKYKLALNPRKLSPEPRRKNTCICTPSRRKTHAHMKILAINGGGRGEALIPQFLAHLLMHDAYSETRNLSIYSV